MLSVVMLSVVMLSAMAPFKKDPRPNYQSSVHDSGMIETRVVNKIGLNFYGILSDLRMS